MRIAMSRRAWQGWLAGFLGLVAAGWWWQVHGLAGSQDAAIPFNSKAVTISPSFAKQPLAFEPNRGQSDGRVLFLSHNPGYSLFLTSQEAVVSLRGAAQPLRLAWSGANPRPEVSGQESLPGIRNYLRGNDPAKWQRGVPTYAKVRYSDLYPGIDLVYYGRQRHLEYDLVVAPGADPARIRLRLAGMDTMKLDEQGALQLQVAQRTLSLSKPVIYQEAAGKRKAVDGGYILLADNQVGLRLGAYDTTKPLIIDPVLNYSSYLGGTGAEQGKGVAVDGSGSVYMVGQTASTDFPFTIGTKTASDTDVFVAKFDSTSGTLLAATFLGGSGTDRGFAIVADNTAVYIVGDTSSTSTFPTVNNDQPGYGGGSTDAFVAKLNTNLGLVFSSYLGGINTDEALGIALDDSAGGGNIYVSGSTLSNDFPTTGGSSFNAGTTTGNNCSDPSSGSPIPCSDAFVVKYDNDGVKQYAVYLGGPREEVATAVAVNSAGEAYLTGITYSTVSFPGVTKSSFNETINGGPGDAFIIKLNSDGTVSYGTYLGGNGFDQGQAIALDNAGNVYVAGITNSSNLPVVNPLQTTFLGGGLDAFVVKMDPTITSPVYLTYLGGSQQSTTVPFSGQDQAFGIAVKGSGSTAVAYVVGETMSADFPENTPLQSIWLGGGKNGWGDMFITQIGSTGVLGWSTFLGGGDDDWANSVALDGSGNLYVAGSSYSTDFPTTANAYQASLAGSSDAVLLKLSDTSAPPDLQVNVSGSPALVGTAETLTYTVVVSNSSTTFPADGIVVVATLPSGINYQSATVPGGSCSNSGTQVTCNVGTVAASGSATITITTVNNTAGDITFTAKVVRVDQSFTDSSGNSSSASTTTKAAQGSSGGGGGAWSLLEWIAVMIFYLRGRRREGILPLSE